MYEVSHNFAILKPDQSKTQSKYTHTEEFIDLKCEFDNTIGQVINILFSLD